VLDTNRLKNANGQLWLNVASSTCVEPEFVNFDNHVFLNVAKLPAGVDALVPRKYRPFLARYRDAKRSATLLRHDCRKPLPLPPNTADHILCSHFLEHVYPNEAKEILTGFRKILKPGGTLHIIVPDLEYQVNQYVQERQSGERLAANQLVARTLLTKSDRGTLKFRALEALGAFGLTHRWMYDVDTIGHLVQEAGFDVRKDITTPSDHVRSDDPESIHVKAMK
jgi:predicted SAM-dependent methyltransferase